MSTLHDKKTDITFEYGSEEQRIGSYADITRISINPYTISFEFAQAIPPHASGHHAPAKMINRIVMSPGHAKALFNILSQNLKVYEEKFGEIKTFEENPPKK